MFYLERLFHRTTFKQKLFLGLCGFLFLYLCLSDTTFVGHIRVRLLSLSNLRTRGDGTYSHQYGQLVTNRSGDFVNFNLPSLNDFHMERDFYRYDMDDQKSETKSKSKYCLRQGTKFAGTKCTCKSDYIGEECAIPGLIHQTVPKNVTAKITRLRKPRRILISLIWPTYDYADGNRTSKAIRLQSLLRAFHSLSQFADLVVVHELIFTSNVSTIVTDPFSLAYQFKHGAFVQYSQFCLLFSRMVLTRTNLKSDYWASVEFELMRQSWLLFSSRITEYRPEDFLLFLSINNLPRPDLLLYLKYHTGLMDIIHLKPVHTWAPIVSIGNNGTLTVSIDPLSRLALHNNQSNESKSNVSALSQNQSKYINHLQNVIVTFEFISYLCGFNFASFYTKLCLIDQKQMDRFERNFWSIQHLAVGDDRLNLSATFTIR